MKGWRDDSRGVRGRCRGRRPGGPGERRDARFIRRRDARRRTEGVELDVAARDGREHGDDGAAPPLGPRGKGVGAFDRRRVAGMGLLDARRRGSRPRGGGGPADARAGAARQPDLPRVPCPGRARAASGGAPRLDRERGARARRRARRAGARERRRPRAHARRPRHAAPLRPRQVRDRRRRRAQQRAGGVRDPVRRRRERCGAPRGRVPWPGLGARPRAPLRHLLPRRAAAASFPPASRTAGCSGWSGTAAQPSMRAR